MIKWFRLSPFNFKTINFLYSWATFQNFLSEEDFTLYAIYMLRTTYVKFSLERKFWNVALDYIDLSIAWFAIHILFLSI